MQSMWIIEGVTLHFYTSIWFGISDQHSPAVLQDRKHFAAAINYIVQWPSLSLLYFENTRIYFSVPFFAYIVGFFFFTEQHNVWKWGMVNNIHNA